MVADAASSGGARDGGGSRAGDAGALAGPDQFWGGNELGPHFDRGEQRYLWGASTTRER